MKLTDQDQARADYELDVLRDFFGTSTKPETRRAAVTYTCNWLLAQPASPLRTIPGHQVPAAVERAIVRTYLSTRAASTAAVIFAYEQLLMARIAGTSRAMEVDPAEAVKAA
jgi:hypothetical protein